MRNELGRVFAVQEPGDARPFALVRQNPQTRLPELWTRLDGWIDCPIMLSYFYDKPGLRTLNEDAVEQLMRDPNIGAYSAGAIELLRGRP
jgi:hypothetical protein